MNLAKNTMFILIALFIDGLQAAISGGIAMIAAFPGTAGGAGATLACLVAGEDSGFLINLGCWVGGGVLTIFGSALNPILAPVTVPVGIGIGLAVNTTLAIVLGWAFLVPLMWFFHTHVSLKRLAWGGGEMIPGVNNVPFWTFFVIASLWDGATSKKGAKGGLFSLATKRLTRSDSQETTLPRQPIAMPQLAANNNVGSESDETSLETDKALPAHHSRIPLPNMSFDVRPPRAANDDYQRYAQAA